jgi:iron complex transport system ATP-binding protein
VWLAMTLAQRTDLLLLDEPTTFLDLAHQVEVLDLLVDLNRSRGTTVVMVLHDLGLAARYADHLVAMRAGRVHAAGTPAEVVTEALVRDVFDLECRVVTDPISGTPLIVPIGRHHRPSGVTS